MALEGAQRKRRRLAGFLAGWSVVAAVHGAAQFAVVGANALSNVLALGGLAATAALGFVVVSRTAHTVGWLLLAAAAAFSTMISAAGYAARGGAENVLGHLPGAAVAAWLSDVLWLPATVLLVVFIPLLFPDGRLPSARWRPLAGVALAGSVLNWIPLVLEPTLYDYPGTAAPLAFASLPGGVADAVSMAGALLVAVGIVGAILAPIIRWRRGDATERQQLKWLFAALGVLVFGQLIGNVLEVTSVGAQVASSLGLVAVPAALAAAILRYRLYDIERLVRRTSGYVLVSAALAGVYVLLVVVVHAAVPASRSSDVAVAAATLATVALLRPVHRRIQDEIERRFNRRHARAAETVEGFAGRLRDEVDLGTLREDLRDTAWRSVEPETVSVWIRGSTDP